jgi:hypothetical protein
VSDDDDATYIESTGPAPATFGMPALDTPTGDVSIVIRHRRST